MADDHVLVTQDSTDTQLACLESTEPLLATPDASETVKQVRFMFVMDGTQLRLLQEDEDPLVVSGHYLEWSKYSLAAFIVYFLFFYFYFFYFFLNIYFLFLFSLLLFFFF